MPSVPKILTHYSPRVELVLSIAEAAFSSFIMIHSAIKGENLMYRAGTSTLSPSRRIGTAAFANARREQVGKQLDLLIDDEPLPTSAELPTESHLYRAVVSSVSLVVGAHNVATGRTPFKKLPFSRAGRAHQGLVVLVAGYVLLHSAQELYRRRSELTRQAGHVAGFASTFVQSKLQFIRDQFGSPGSDLETIQEEYRHLIETSPELVEAARRRLEEMLGLKPPPEEA